MNISNAICRGFVGLIIIAAGNRASTLAADSSGGPESAKQAADSELRYRFASGQSLVYDVKIEADLPDSVETHEGQLTYNVKAVDAEGNATLTCSGNLAKHDAPKHQQRFGPPHIPMLSPMRGMFRPAEAAEIVADPHGNLVKYNEAASDAQLPFLLGPTIQLVLEPLPTDKAAAWTSEQPIAVYERDSGRTYLTAKETTTFTVEQPTADATVIHKRIQLATNAKSGDEPYLQLEGDCQVTFDRSMQLVRRIDSKMTIKINQDNTTVRVPVTMSVRLLDAAEVEKLAATRKADEVAAHARQIEDAKPKVLDASAITALLADLQSGDGFKVNGACDKLAKSVLVDSRQAEVEEALDRLLARGSQNFGPAKDAARALRIWGTKKSVPALAAVVDDKDSFTRAEIIKTLAKFNDPRGAEAIAGVFYIGFGRDVATQALTDMGATAEPYVIPLLGDREESVRKDAAELLGKIGTDKSLRPLESLEAKETGWTKEAVTKAIAAIKDRQRPNVQ
jgi:hypothetical protein